jgi:hypothetical protein
MQNPMPSNEKGQGRYASGRSPSSVLRPLSAIPRVVRRIRHKLSFAPAVVTDEQRRQFDRDGYLVIDPQVPDELVEQIKADLEGKHMRAPAGRVGYPFIHRIQDAWEFSDAVRQLVVWPRVLQILRELYGREPLPFQSLNFPVGTEQKVHSDAIHFNTIPAGWMCGVWFALEEIDEDCGPLVYYPGSHKLREYTLEDIPVEVVPGTYQNYHHYENFVVELIKAHNLRPRYATMRQGQAFIWSSNLLHGGSKRRDVNRSRHSQVNHFFFEGCQYYTPLWSTRERVFWRDPIWITEVKAARRRAA